MSQAQQGAIPAPPASPAQAPIWDSARRQIGDGLLSVIMPAHNLGSSIADNIRHVCAIFDRELPFELVVVDDGSTDQTADELRKAGAAFPGLRAVCLNRNVGKGGALKRGFEACRGNYVLLLDGDLDLAVGR